MNIFDLDRDIIRRYEGFSRSFTEIRATDLRQQIDAIYDSNVFWPEPLISLNPRYREGPSVDELIAQGVADPALGEVFALGQPRRAIRLFRHQEQAFHKAQARRSYIVTTGTGSGKSLCFFVPIVDRMLRARRQGEPRRTRAVVIYPMNALANSQLEELGKFVDDSNLPESLKPTFARFTGQESDSERRKIAATPPDILLTNFMMLELLMTRQDELDQRVIENMRGLEFLVLDELHTYRGRQGADVAMLVRRVRERTGNDKLLCIGTSATMASGDEDAGRKAVSEVGTRLFGSRVEPDDVITESLARCTEWLGSAASFMAALRDAVANPSARTGDWKHDPLAVWIELNIGLEVDEKLTRAKPRPLNEAAHDLASETGCDFETCEAALRHRLTAMSTDQSGSGNAFMAFKLHRFIGGPGHAHATLEPAGRRRATLAAEKFDREKPDARLYPLFFCRHCGQEVHSVSVEREGQVVARSIDLTPRDEPDEDGTVHGFLVPDAEGSLDFDGSPSAYPDDWTEEAADGKLRLKSSHRGKHEGRKYVLGRNGRPAREGVTAWFFAGKYRFCPRCKYEPASQARDINKLASLSGEGRSSATTLITSAMLDWMERNQTPRERHRRKLLGFTDNRQDAALQSGHFNDFVFVTLLRGAMLRSVRQAGCEGLSHEQFGDALRRALGFDPENRSRREEWMLDPEPRGFSVLDDAKRIINQVLAHRLWNDLRRGWRYTNPNLDQLALIKVEYPGIPMLAADEELFADTPQLAKLSPDLRAALFRTLFEVMRNGLAVSVDALDPTVLTQVAERSREFLKSPWSIDREEEERDLARQGVLVVGTNVKGGATIVKASARSMLGRAISEYLGGLPLAEREPIIATLLVAAERHHMVRRVGDGGWRLAPNAIRLVAGDGQPKPGQGNEFFAQLYADVSERLGEPGRLPFAFESREHTAQVDSDVRRWREDRFRFGEADRKRLAEEAEDMRSWGERTDFLPLLFCSPTMELGIDISQLNIVYLRNAPPTPANYAQRAGRAGRSGQAALVITYCAAQSPHDQYYFNRRSHLVSGIVEPPVIDLANPDLLASHVRAEWLATAGKPLGKSIPENLKMDVAEHPVTERLIEAFAKATADTDAEARAVKIVRSALETATTDEIDDPAEFVHRHWTAAVADFDAAFQRWRTLYDSAARERWEANEIAQRPGLSAPARKEARSRWIAADRQVGLLEAGTSSASSDFYTYRYLATEGFLPGYNFPRLPLYAFINQETASAVLQRPRFLAISEFGPNALVYHEGKAYRCYRAKIPAGSLGEGQTLVTQTYTCCSNCGAAHVEKTRERCTACGTLLTAEGQIQDLFRIENVDASPSSRITANDEDRQRRGFEILTVFRWRGDGEKVMDLCADGKPLLSLRYGPQTTLSRLNLGLRRRAKKEARGFDIDIVTGRWIKNEAKGEHEGADPGREVRRQTIVPMVEDTKNALLVRFGVQLTLEEMATVQHALVRAIETEHVLQTGELLGEPLPARDTRNAILLYEASEGGAGVLKRLMESPGRWHAVGKQALELMHFRCEAGEWIDDPEAEPCVAGCYRCLLSYYNQPDHELIDRRAPKVRALFAAFTRAELAPESDFVDVDDDWSLALERWGAPPPTAETIDGKVYPLCWPGRLVMAVVGSAPPSLVSLCADLGRDLIELPATPGEQMPQALADRLGVTL